MTDLKAQSLPEDDWERWDVFVGAAPRASLFQTSWWYRAWDIQPEIIVVTDGREAITAGIAAQVARQIGFRALRRPALTPINAPVVSVPSDGSATRQTSQVRRQLQLLIAALPRIAMVDFALHTDLLDPAPFVWLGFDAMIGVTYVIPAGTTDWRARMSAQRRRQLQKATHELGERGGRIDPAPEIGEVAALLADTAEIKNYRRSAKHALANVERWWQVVAARGAGRLYGLRDADGELLCATVLVWDRRKAYYLGGGVKPAIRRASHLNCLLFERMIDDALARGLDFDFEGSVVQGVERFFRAWGGALQPTYRFVKIGSPAAFALWQTYRFLSFHRRPLAMPASEGS